MKLAYLPPVIFCIIAVGLVSNGLQAGSTTGTMDQYEIIRFNTSELGKVLMNKISIRGFSLPGGSGGSCGVLDQICNGVTSVAGGIATKATSVAEPIATDITSVAGVVATKVTSVAGVVATAVTSVAGALETDLVKALQDIENDIVDKLADVLGIKEFYDLHTPNICEGVFTPNPTVANPGLNVTSCTSPFHSDFNISSILDQELNVGPFHLNLADLGFTKDIQDAFDALHMATQVFAGFYIITLIFVLFSLIGSLWTFVRVCFGYNVSRKWGWLIVLISFGSFFVMTVACAVITGGVYAIVSEANKWGGDIGLVAIAGSNFHNLIWWAWAMLLLNLLFWLLDLFRKTDRGQRLQERFGGRGNHGFEPGLNNYGQA